MLKISISSGINQNNGGSLRRFCHLKELGYDAVDYQEFATAPGTGLFALSDARFEAFLKEEAQIAKETGIELIQTHGVWPYDDTDPTQKDLKFEAMIKSIIGTSILGAKYVVIHPVLPSMWRPSKHHEADVEENMEYIRRLLPYAEKYHVILALENMPNRDVPCGTVQELLESIDALNNPYLKACLDSGHCTAIGDDAGEMIRLLGNRIACVHLHDNNGKSDQHSLPFFGVADWMGMMRALKEIGYTGTINFETDIPGKMPEPLRNEQERWLAKVAHMFAEAAS